MLEKVSSERCCKNNSIYLCDREERYSKCVQVLKIRYYV